ncbi:MAG TPA: RDD family protein [Thermoanaerobaculia bacterium]|nr:RDD family protein [Thermoanaerobaculia bacterium]
MRRPEEEPDEPLLFDLPLEVERGRPAPPERKRARTPREDPPPQDVAEPVGAPLVGALGKGGHEGRPYSRAGLGSRLAAGAADLLVHAAVTVGALVGCRMLGVMPALNDWPAVAVFVLSFSFLYTVVPLAFWGHTPGMAWAGLDARSRDGQALAFDQTARRWIGGILTILLLGLPILLALGGRSLSDLVSGSETLSSRASA